MSFDNVSLALAAAAIGMAKPVGLNRENRDWKPFSQMTVEEIAEREFREERQRMEEISRREHAKAFFRADAERRRKLAEINDPVQAKRNKELFDRRHTGVKGKAQKKAAKRFMRRNGPL